jgi:hypothetical protein
MYNLGQIKLALRAIVAAKSLLWLGRRVARNTGIVKSTQREW